MNETVARTVRWISLTLALAVASAVLGIVAVTFASIQGEVGMGIALRTILELFALVSIVAFCARLWQDYGWGFWLSSAAVGYLLNPLSWTGQALAGRSVVSSAGPIAAVMDLVTWLAVAAAVVWVQGRRHDGPPIPADVRELLR
ncbi:hypothetical protein [Branchiibius cervicis]|uniref:Uncharacterized protein n=1 Tax=Branchiibius cervicis TaxID=908252 RepID=A0ABW2AWQ7_9MICO